MDLIFVQGLVSLFCMWKFSFSKTICWRCGSFIIVNYFVPYQIAVVSTHVWFFYLIPLVYMALVILLPHCFYYYNFIICLEVWKSYPSILFTQDFFGYLELCLVQRDFRIFPLLALWRMLWIFWLGFHWICKLDLTGW